MKSLIVIFSDSKYFAIAFLFASLSMLFSTWAVNIPVISGKLGLSEGHIGTGIFFSAIGAIVATPLGKSFVRRFTVGVLSFIGIIMYALAANIVFLSPNFIILCMALFLFGFSSGITAIAINSLVATAERLDDVKIMSSIHGFYSGGAMIGASIGSLLIKTLPDHRLHILLVSLVVLSIHIALRKNYMSIKDLPATDDNKKKVNNIFPLIGLTVVAVISMVSEGAVADWSALYLTNIVLLDLSIAGFGFGGFSLAMTLGRFFGDAISNRYRSWQIIGSAYLLATIGFILVISGHKWLAIGGFTIAGLGMSVIVPEVLRAAAKLDHIEIASAVSFIFGVGFTAFLGGPVILGFVAEASDLRISMVIVLAFLLIALCVSGFHIYMKRNKQKQN